LVSQDPSWKAWANGVTFPEPGSIVSGNPTWENFAAELLGQECVAVFTPQRFCWTQSANCYTGLQERGLDARAKEMLRRCYDNWRDKILYQHLRDGAYRWQLIIIIGWAALAWIRGGPGIVPNVTEAVRMSVRDSRALFDQCDCFAIHNPSGSNRELNKKDVRKLQEEVIRKIRESANRIICP
jgi:hypothetical protein